MKGYAIRVPMAALALTLAGCGAPEFSAQTAKEAIETKPLDLHREQLILTDEQVTCGDREELWHVTQLGPGHIVGRLTPAGQKLNFSDDVRVAGPGQGSSRVQVSGTFPLRVLTVSSIEDQGANAKRVEARTAVVIEHECFKRPLPMLMGIRKGEFSASTAPMFQMKMREFTWSVDELVHP
jgi:hypothetical protein